MKTIRISLLGLTALAFSSLNLLADSEAIDATAVWKANCKKCHAEDGSGATKIGQKLGIKDYTDANVQASMTDEEIVKTTKEGVFDGGKKKMPPYAEKLSEEEIQAMVPLIRSFAK
ncbi:c-type cytochrome [Coraliomargarita parva]|uniref:c-type cytochrome n=1 Tax=Coraliomargarita parva TaxID=3014050 RepID=UPI0022B357A7|nr:cytochrome c [Coraliomargarita parva]